MHFRKSNTELSMHFRKATQSSFFPKFSQESPLICQPIEEFADKFRQELLAGCIRLRPITDRVAKSNFFVNSENLGIRIWRKNCVNYDKIENAARLRKSHIYPKCIVFLPFDRCYRILPCYLHSSYIICIIYRLRRWYFKFISNLHVQR